MGVGLCGGLGEYFGVDPVIFRVLLAVLTVFGGAGVVIYLIGWLAVPEEGRPNSGLDRLVADLHRRRLPYVLVVAAVLLIGWLSLFSWWAPRALLPAVVATAVVLVVLARRDDPRIRSAAGLGPVPPGPAPEATYADPDSQATAPVPPAARQMRVWVNEATERSRERRRRSRPLRVAVLVSVLVAVGILAVVDALTGVPFALYFWTIGGIALAGLVVGAAARRTPWSVAWLPVVAVLGLLVFASSGTRAHDGWGDKQWSPSSYAQVHDQYRTAFGRTTVDLTSVPAVAGDRTVRVEHGTGQVRLVIPGSLPVRLHIDVHAGQIERNGIEQHSGLNFTRDFMTPAVADARTGILDVDVHVAAGQVTIDQVG